MRSRIALSTLALLSLAAPAALGMPSVPGASPDPNAGLARSMLADPAVRARLEASGLSPAEARERLERLDPETLRRLSEGAASVQEGGNIGIAIAALVVLITFLTLLFTGGLTEDSSTYPGPGRPRR